MNTTDHPPAKNSSTPSGRRYSSVTEMMAGEGLPQEVKSRVNELSQESKITRTLAKLRAQHGLTQEELGLRIGLSQSAVSKLESGSDEDLTLADIRKYSTALDERIGFRIGKPLSAVEAIKLHAQGMRYYMLELTKLAATDQNIDRAIQAFFGEAFFNILEILTTCQNKMPNGIQGCEIKMDVVSDKGHTHLSAPSPRQNQPVLV